MFYASGGARLGHSQEIPGGAFKRGYLLPILQWEIGFKWRLCLVPHTNAVNVGNFVFKVGNTLVSMTINVNFKLKALTFECMNFRKILKL